MISNNISIKLMQTSYSSQTSCLHEVGVQSYNKLMHLKCVYNLPPKEASLPKGDMQETLRMPVSTTSFMSEGSFIQRPLVGGGDSAL